MKTKKNFLTEANQLKIKKGKGAFAVFLSLFLIFNFSFLIGFAQNIAINTTGAAANAVALLDIGTAGGGDTKGILIPRVSLTITTSNAPIGAGVITSLLVYNNATVADVTPGYYYWDGVKWVRMLNGGSAAPAWLTLGNAGTTAGTNFLGTTDAQDVVIKANNTEGFRLYSGGIMASLGVGVGAAPITTSAQATLVLKSSTSNFQINAQDGSRTALLWNASGTGGNYLVTGEPAVRQRFHIATGGYIDFAGAPAGTAGNPITWTTMGAMESSNYVWFSPRGTSSDFYISAATGFVGIGTAAPAQVLHVVGTERVSTLVSGVNGAIVRSNTNGDLAITNFTGNTTDILLGNNTFGTIATAGGVTSSCGIVSYVPRMTSATNIGCSQIFDNLTNVGIGTAAPGAKLDVVGNVRAGSATPNAYMGTHPTYGNAFAAWWKDGVDYSLLTDGSNSFLNAPAAAGNIYFRTLNADKMFLQGSNGFFGIGTVAPLEKLHVVGNIRASSLAVASNRVVLADLNGTLITMAAGTSGQVLTSGGAGAPTWTTPGASAGWLLLGNGGTVDGTNFLGTTDNIPLNFRVNNQPSGRMAPVDLNTSYGYQSLLTGTGYGNVAIGHQALMSNNRNDGLFYGWGNVCVGYQTMMNNTDGSWNTALGNGTLQRNTTGRYNSAFGNVALTWNTTGSSNTAFGTGAFRFNTGSWNTAVGDSAGQVNTTGTNNIFVGYNADATLNNLNNATAIGAYSRVSANNSMILGGTGAYAVNVGIGTTSPLSLIHVVNSGVNNTVVGQFDFTGGNVGGTTEGCALLRVTTNSIFRPLLSLVPSAGTGVLVTASGSVGIGTTTPGAKLDLIGNGLGTTAGNTDVYEQLQGSVSGNTQLMRFFTSRSSSSGTWGSSDLWLQRRIDVSDMGFIKWSGSDWGIEFGSGTTTFMKVASNGAVGIGTLTPNAAYKLDIAGNLNVCGNVGYTTISGCSDIRYKKDITPLPNALNNVMQLRGVHYFWKTKEFPDKKFTDDQQIGFIAQEIEKIYPEVVVTGTDGYKSVDYSRLTPVLVEAMKEQQKMIDNLKSENEKLKINSEARISKLETEMKLVMQTTKEEAKK